MEATTAEESTPPLRKAPRGTSATMRTLTASSKMGAKASSASSGARGTGGLEHHVPVLVEPHLAALPHQELGGGTWWMSWNTVFGLGMFPNEK